MGILVGGLVGASIMARVVGKASMVETRRIAGSRGMVILECFAVFCGVAMIAVVAAILGHIGIKRSGGLAWWRDEVSL